MDFLSFSDAFTWISTHGYPLIFLALLIEGPVVTAAAAFAAALGYFNIWILILLSFCGDLVGDILYYWIGYWGRNTIAEKYGHYVGISKERINQIETYLLEHSVKGLLIIKWFPVLPTFGLLAAGAIRMPFRKFFGVVSLVIIPRTLLFIALGFFFGKAYDTIAHYIHNALVTILIIGTLAIVTYFAYRKITRRVSNAIGPHQDGL